MWAPKYFHFLGEALEAVPEERRRFGLVILMIGAFHALVFLIVHVSYPEASAVLTPARQRLMLYAPQPGTGRVPTVADIGFWSRIDDPSLVVFPPDVLTLPDSAQGGDARYHASGELDTGAVPAQALVALDPDVRTLPDRLAPLSQRAADALAGAGPKQVFRYNFAPFLPAASGTTVRWSGNGEGGSFGTRAPAQWALPAVPSDLLPEAGTTVLRLAVDEAGRVVHVLVEESCGNSETDLAAVVSARHLRFAPALENGPLQWGNATVYWKFIPKGGSAPAAGATP